MSTVSPGLPVDDGFVNSGFVVVSDVDVVCTGVVGNCCGGFLVVVLVKVVCSGPAVEEAVVICGFKVVPVVGVVCSGNVCGGFLVVGSSLNT